MQMPGPGFMLQRGTRLHVARPSYYPRIHNVSANNPSGGSLMNVQRLPSDIIGLSKVMPPLSRRGFMSSSAAAAAGYTLAAGPVRADAIQTDTKGLKAGMADVAVSGGNMPVYFARPENVQNPPVILVCMEIFGLHEWVKDVTRRVAHLGAFAIAPNYYFRAESNGTDLTKIEDMTKLFPIVNAKTDTELFADLDATVAWAKAQGGDTSKLGIMGFCRGGRNVWHYSTHNADLKAGVAFYGSLIDKNDAAPKSSIDLAPEVKEPVLGLYGEADTGITPDQVKQMEAAMKAAGKTAEFHEYPGSPHGFVADYRPSYRKEAAEGAWAEMTAWFKKYGVLS
jgi:carboxymethylenebutenolidase